MAKKKGKKLKLTLGAIQDLQRVPDVAGGSNSQTEDEPALSIGDEASPTPDTDWQTSPDAPDVRLKIGTPQFISRKKSEKTPDWLEEEASAAPRPGSIPGRVLQATLGAAAGAGGSGFDPDKYLAEKQSGGFDPEAYLEEKSVPHVLVKTLQPGELPDDVDTMPLPEKKADPGGLRASILGFSQGGTKGWADEIGGGIGSFLDLARHLRGEDVQPGPNASPELRKMVEDRPSLGDLTKQGMRDEYAGAMENRPVETMAGAGAGDLLSDYAGGKLLKMDPTSVAYQTQMGAVSGLGSGEGGAGRQALGTALGAGAGFAGAKLGNALSEATKAGPVAGAIDKKLAEVTEAQRAKLAEEAAKELRSGIGALGGESSNAMRKIEMAERILEHPAATPEQRRKAFDYLRSDEATKLYRIAFDNVLEEAPQAAGRVETARAALDPLRAATAPDVIEKATQEAMEKPVRKYMLPRAAKYAQRAIPAVIAGKLGGAPGAVAGGVVGAAIGHPGTALKNMLSTPAVKALGLNTAKSALVNAPAAIARQGGLLARQYQRDPGLLDELLGESDPELALAKARAAALRR